MRINLEKSSGIYQIRNTKNQKRYVGLSKNVFNRCSEHLYALRNGKHPNDYLQKAWNADAEAFVFEIIEYCSVDYQIAP